MPTPATPTLSLAESMWSGSWRYGAPHCRIVFVVPDPDLVLGVLIERNSGGGYGEHIAEVGDEDGAPAQWFDLSVEDGTAYSYRIRTYCNVEGTIEYSAYSDEKSALTTLPTPGYLTGTASTNSVILRWEDYAKNESGYEIWRDGTLVHTTGQNGVSWTDTGLYSSRWYAYQVRAVNALTGGAASDTLNIFTSDPPNSPSALIVTPTGTTTMRLAWTDNADNETGFTILRSDDGGANYTPVGTVGANVTTWDDSGLTSNTLYVYMVEATNGSGASYPCSPVSASTWADIAQPTGLTVTPWGSGTLEIVFQDNSTLEDGHSIEESADGATGWAEIVELVPNRTYYPRTGLGAGVTKYYRIRARQGAVYSSYSVIVSGTTLSLPGTPTAFAISEYQDKWARLTWAGSAGAAGYKIERSPNGTTGWAEIGRVMAGVEYYRAKGLTPGTAYWFKIRAYNGAGNGSYTGAETVTTRAVYLESKFETLCRSTTRAGMFLMEVNPLKVVTGWALTSGKTYTYEYAITDAGIDFDGLSENGVALAKKTSTADVESAAGSWYCDFMGRKLYVHASTGVDPVNFYYTGSAWFYFSTGGIDDETNKASAVVFNDKYYHPLIPEDGVPSVDSEIKPFWEGGFSTNLGQAQLINKKGPTGEFFFDKKFQGFIWENRLLRILAGHSDFSYSEFWPWSAGTITDGANLNNSRFTLPLRDSRDALRGIKLPVSKYSLDLFPAMDPSAVDKWRSFHFGVVVGAVPVCIDVVNRVFEFQAGRAKALAAVYQNGSTLTAATDYYIDYQRGRFTLARGLAYSTADKITCDLTGAVDATNDAIQTDAAIFLYGCLNFAGQTLAQLGLDSIYETMETQSGARGLSLYKDTDFGTFMRRLEVGSTAFTFQDEYGRIGLRSTPTVANSHVIYVSEQFLEDDFSMETGKDSRYKTVNIQYAENPSTEQFAIAMANLLTMDWGYGVKAGKDITTALTMAAQADTLKAAIISLMNRPTASVGVKKILYPAQVGSLIYFTRARYYSIAGVASNLLMQIIKINKSVGGKVSIRAIEAAV
jgi:hypothetical protein